ncbi:MAG: peptide ABC transporter substrate-binding protein [Dehalococcoidia bacterium]|nr:peptide ABC transporter substrate-binding protein [Dehalococcoidia bacterium]
MSYIVQIFSGLVSFDADMNLVPDIAESWETDNTNTVYTFHLRQGVSFHDGTPVTAGDFKYSWERACDPGTGSLTAGTYLNDIVGAMDMLAGSAQEMAGVRVVDDRTLQVAIDQPRAYFLSKLAQPVAFVVDRGNVESDKNWWRKPNGTGPFKLNGWEAGKLLLLERNTRYYREQARVRYVAFLLSGGYSTQMYERNQIHVTGISIYDLERVRDPSNRLHSQLAIFTQYNITYLGFNTTKAPFSDARVRRAFCLAVDRERVVRQVLLDSVAAARGIVPPGMLAYDPAFTGLPYDVEAARVLLAEAGYGPGGSPLKVVVTLPGSSGEVATYLTAILYQWRENLGAEVEIRQLDGDAYFDRLDDEKDDVFYYGWSADYPDPQDFLDVLFRSGSVNNVGGYSSAAYDALLDQAAITGDETVRENLYRQAEVRLITEDAACLPLWFGKSYLLIKPTVEGYVMSPLGYPLLASVSVSD